MRATAPLLILILTLALLVLPAYGAEELIDDTAYSNEETTYSIVGGQLTGKTKFAFNKIQSFDDISLIQYYGAAPNFASIAAGTGSFTMTLSGSTIATGDWSIFRTSPTGDWSLHLQFDSFDRGSNTGAKTADITWTGTPTISQAGSGATAKFTGPSYIATGSTDYSCGVTSQTSAQYYLPFHTCAVYFTETSKVVAHSDSYGGIIGLWAQRVNIGGTNAYASHVEYEEYPSGATIFSDSSSVNTSTIYFGTGQVLMTVTLPTGTTESILYESDGTYTKGGATSSDISVNLWEKYSNAAIINQAVTVTPVSGGSGETKTSLYGETLHFSVVPGDTYWFNASRTGYNDYNQTYTIPTPPGIYTVYMERTLTPIANHSYAHFSVVDQTNGGLIPNAEIRLSDGQTKLTNSAGYTYFSVNNSEQINYYVSKTSGYWPAYGAFNITADESILVALQRYTGPTATATMPGWTPVTVPTTGTGSGPVVTLSAQLREQNVQEGMDVWYTTLPFISQFLFLLFIIGGLGLMAGGTRRN
jgi:hypothetical protein